MKETILGFDQGVAVRLGLDVVDLMLLDLVKQKEQSTNSKVREIAGEKFVWVHYQNVLDYLPILGFKKRALAAKFDRLVDACLLEKQVIRDDGGTYVYFRSRGVPLEQHPGCRSNSRGVSLEQQPDKHRSTTTVAKKKEKDNKLSQKKDGDFDTAFLDFCAKCVADQELAYSLSPYKVKNLEALLKEFMHHIIKHANMADFIKNGYIKNRMWMLRSIPFIDMSGATGIALGYGEFIKDNRRWYKNRSGNVIEVPMDAPPRRQGTIWYKEQGRWGPDI